MFERKGGRMLAVIFSVIPSELEPYGDLSTSHT